MTITKLQNHIKNLNPSTEIMAVTKSATIPEMQKLYAAGFRLFGESRIQDVPEKKLALPYPDIKWHLIGHLQTNKVKKAVELFDCIQSVDSLRLAQKINECAKTINKKMPILLEINLSGESQKFGFSENELETVLPELAHFSHLELHGVMIMGPHTTDTKRIEHTFSLGKDLHYRLKTLYNSISVLSMGMSDDYELAISAGSTQVRIGTTLINLVK